LEDLIFNERSKGRLACFRSASFFVTKYKQHTCSWQKGQPRDLTKTARDTFEFGCFKIWFMVLSSPVNLRTVLELNTSLGFCARALSDGLPEYDAHPQSSSVAMAFSCVLQKVEVPLVCRSDLPPFKLNPRQLPASNAAATVHDKILEVNLIDELEEFSDNEPEDFSHTWNANL
jgi:hypothetical protein